jgi:hypothetical protein
MNPELRRNLWLQFSILRLILPPVAIGIVLLLVWLVSAHSLTVAAASAEWFYLLIVLLWGTRRAADLVAEEIAGGTWDSQRMSALGAWQMTWGKFIGGINYVWYAAGIAFIARLWAFGLAGRLPWQGEAAVQNLHLLGIGLLGQAVAFLTSLVLLRKQVMRRRLGVTLSQFAGLAASAAASGHLDLSLLFRQMPVIDWFGWRFPGAEFALGTLGLFLAWSLFGAYRLMRVELQFRSTPWAWTAFALFMMVYADGLLYSPIREAASGLAAWLIGPFTIAILLTYAALFLEPKDVVRYRGLWAALRAGHGRHAASLLPQWLPVYLIAAALGIALTAVGGLSELTGVPSLVGSALSVAEYAAAAGLRALPVALVLYLLRDGLVVLYFNFGKRRGRADLMAFICLLLAYFPLLGILVSLGITSLIPIVAPYPPASPLITIGAPLIESLILGLLVLKRTRAAGRFKAVAA